MAYKLKTNSAAKKRFKIRPGGKVSYKQRGVRHNAGSKSQKRKRQLRGTTELILRDEKKIKELFPYAR
ncbi:MAG: 50S ribosomal protein L35 [Myxococcales bacterium]